MRKIFYGVTYMILLVMLFTYMLIDIKFLDGEKPLLVAVGFTGLSIIGFILLIPAFVFTIIALVSGSDVNEFIRDMFSVFSTAFILVSVIIVFTLGVTEFYIPIILTLSGAILFGFAIKGVVVGIRKDAEKKKVDIEEVKE